MAASLTPRVEVEEEKHIITQPPSLPEFKRISTIAEVYSAFT
jgi:hypothetical protein